MRIWNGCSGIAIVILNICVLCGHCSALRYNAESTCQYEAGLLTVSTVNSTEAKGCLQKYSHATQLLYTRSNLVEIPEYVNILKDLTELDLSDNDIADLSLDVLQNKICANLRTLRLDRNNITILKANSLHCLQDIYHFSVRNNSLSTIENGTFTSKMARLEIIDLCYNKLTAIDTSLLSRVKVQWHNQVHVRVNASWNDVEIITNSINLTINDISFETEVILILVHNNFTAVNADYYFTIFNVKDKLSLWRLVNCGFDIRFNPLICDCSLYTFSLLLRFFHKMDPDNPMFSITCGHPDRLNGKLVREVAPNDFNCSISHQCPVGCNCILTISLDLVTVHCDDRYNQFDLPPYCPQATELHIDMNTNRLVRISPRSYMTNVTSLDVSGCGISDVSNAARKQLEKIRNIYLHDNKMSYIPTSFKAFKFSHGQTITLYGNPFACDCHAVWMKKWLIKNKNNVPYEDKTYCASGPGRGSAVVDVPDSEFTCPVILPLYVILVISGGCFLILVFAFFVFSYFRTNIQVFLFANFGIFRYCCRSRTEGTFEYDIFIPHSCEDDVKVYMILEYLENQNPPYKVCIGERDFKGGGSINELIIHAVNSSQTTLLIISNNFLRSSYCNTEFREAHARFLRDRDINLIIVLLEELNDSLINAELKAYMRSHIYIKFWDKRFLSRLLISLPVIDQPSRSSLNQGDGDESDETSRLLPDRCSDRRTDDTSRLLPNRCSDNQSDDSSRFLPNQCSDGQSDDTYITLSEE